MRLTGNWLVAQNLLTTALFKLLRLVFITVQRIYWQLNGTAQKLREARLPHNYERSAQVLNILLSNSKFFHQEMLTVDNFLCTHNRFENPQYIIDNESVTLLTFTEHDAVFCEAKEKGRHTKFIHLIVGGLFICHRQVMSIINVNCRELNYSTSFMYH